MYQVLNPTSEASVDVRSLAPRPASLAGATVGFISNGKEGSRGFFTHLERQLREQLGVGNVLFRTKGNFSAPAEAAIVRESRGWDLTITGIGD